MYLRRGIVILSFIHSFFLSHGVLFLLVSEGRRPARRSVKFGKKGADDQRKRCTYSIVSSLAFLACGRSGLAPWVAGRPDTYCVFVVHLKFVTYGVFAVAVYVKFIIHVES